MKQSKDRTEQFMYSTATAANHAPSSSYTCLHHPSKLDKLLAGLLYNPSKNDPMGDGSSTSFDSKGKGRAVQNGDILALDLNSAEEGAGAQGAFMQMQMVEQQACVPHSSFHPLYSGTSRTHIFNRDLPL